MLWDSLLNCVPCVLKTSSHSNVPCVLMCSRGNVHCMLTCSRTNVPCVLMCSCANMYCLLTCSRPNLLACSRVNVFYVLSGKTRENVQCILGWKLYSDIFFLLFHFTRFNTTPLIFLVKVMLMRNCKSVKDD